MDDPNEGVDHGCSREPAPKNDRLGSAINPTDTAATNSAQAGDRHLCRNPRCRLKLPAPVSNPKAAFCKRGCFEQFHRRRCVVCEQEYERKREDQRDCRRRKCRAELRRNRLTLLPFEVQKNATRYPSSPDVKVSIGSSIKLHGFWRDRSGRGWYWERLPGEDDDWHLLDRDGRRVARVRQEGTGYWVARPRAIPEPPIESFEDAKRRAVHLAVASLPLDPQTAARVARINKVEPRPVVEHKAPPPLVSSCPVVAAGDNADPWAIPDFLRRTAPTLDDRWGDFPPDDGGA